MQKVNHQSKRLLIQGHKQSFSTRTPQSTSSSLLDWQTYVFIGVALEDV
jgi:hypothetical protein